MHQFLEFCHFLKVVMMLATLANDHMFKASEASDGTQRPPHKVRIKEIRDWKSQRNWKASVPYVYCVFMRLGEAQCLSYMVKNLVQADEMETILNRLGLAAQNLGRTNPKMELVKVFMGVENTFVNCLGLNYTMQHFKFYFIWCF